MQLPTSPQAAVFTLCPNRYWRILWYRCERKCRHAELTVSVSAHLIVVWRLLSRLALSCFWISHQWNWIQVKHRFKFRYRPHESYYTIDIVSMKALPGSYFSYLYTINHLNHRWIKFMLEYSATPNMDTHDLTEGLGSSESSYRLSEYDLVSQGIDILDDLCGVLNRLEIINPQHSTAQQWTVNINELKDNIRQREHNTTIVFTGESGVGKSTLWLAKLLCSQPLAKRPVQLLQFKSLTMIWLVQNTELASSSWINPNGDRSSNWLLLNY